MDSHGHAHAAAGHAHAKAKEDLPKDNIVTFVGGNTDGKNLFLEVDVFDGEHTNKLYPVFPFGTDVKDLIDYAKELIEKDPKFPDELVSLMQTGVSWSAEQDSWMLREAGGKWVPEKSKTEK